MPLSLSLPFPSLLLFSPKKNNFNRGWPDELSARKRTTTTSTKEKKKETKGRVPSRVFKKVIGGNVAPCFQTRTQSLFVCLWGKEGWFEALFFLRLSHDTARTKIHLNLVSNLPSSHKQIANGYKSALLPKNSFREFKNTTRLAATATTMLLSKRFKSGVFCGKREPER